MKFLRLPKDRIVWLLLLVSLVLYFADYYFFGRGGEIGFGFMSNVAFLPVYVLFVTLMLERVIKNRERDALMKKLNMVIGIFFSEVGTQLLRDFLDFFPDGKQISEKLRPTPQWKDKDFHAAHQFLKAQDIRLDSRRGDLPALKAYLLEKKGTLLALMENPNLLEHDAFTDLLWAVFHLVEELQARPSLAGLPESDLEHLSGDMKRAHTHLLIQWVSYMWHLKRDYPYLYSLAVRTNPMNPDAHVVVY